jgi:hypothetical protein
LKVAVQRCGSITTALPSKGFEREVRDEEGPLRVCCAV